MKYGEWKLLESSSKDGDRPVHETIRILVVS